MISWRHIFYVEEMFSKLNFSVKKRYNELHCKFKEFIINRLIHIIYIKLNIKIHLSPHGLA